MPRSTRGREYIIYHKRRSPVLQNYAHFERSKIIFTFGGGLYARTRRARGVSFVFKAEKINKRVAIFEYYFCREPSTTVKRKRGSFKSIFSAYVRARAFIVSSGQLNPINFTPPRPSIYYSTRVFIRPFRKAIVFVERDLERFLPKRRFGTRGRLSGGYATP